MTRNNEKIACGQPLDRRCTSEFCIMTGEKYACQRFNEDAYKRYHSDRYDGRNKPAGIFSRRRVTSGYTLRSGFSRCY